VVLQKVQYAAVLPQVHAGLLSIIPEALRMAKTPSNHGKDWTASDIKTLKQLTRQTTPTRVAALKLGRTPASVYQKASAEGISLKPTNQRPYGRRKK